MGHILTDPHVGHVLVDPYVGHVLADPVFDKAIKIINEYNLSSIEKKCFLENGIF